ncbi:hypothetical protein NX786_14085 [Telluria mixta]|uniref:Uncharacterized protein n=1 Tax=Telluria mixta TaxID=34071 RepID=A0ABT2BZB0_9BURK|nr:hypothetical protein [Telluria mixta]MCS0630465.1 hypothetical protein [Telluria mixta]WEM94232.1 hypothetical protein P0M04_22415 [Telluria mixta]
MKTVLSLAMPLAIVISVSESHAATLDDAAKLIAQRGAKISDVKPIASALSSEIIPAIYYEKGNTVQSCGLFVNAPGKQHPDFVELLSSEPGAGFPQCINITTIVPFRLQNRDYVSVEYIARETRNENYRNFHYLYRDQERGFVVDQELTDAVPNIETTIAEAMPTPAKKLDGIRAARLAYLAKAFPQWKMEQRDFIADANSSFAVFEDKKNSQCHLALETGGKPLVANTAEYAHDEKCVGVLASSRLMRSAITYYLEIFKVGPKKQLVGIMSAAPQGDVKAEKTLSEKINHLGATSDMKTAKGALATTLEQ